ncbi:hypothetical protein Gotri_017815, partial [Gossypium trilobum]|nr:hypothetical protein [Gossypium trilobum]
MKESFDFNPLYSEYEKPPIIEKCLPKSPRESSNCGGLEWRKAVVTVERGEEISLLAEELVMLSVKGSRVVPSSKPTLICTVWTKKLYNPDSFRAHMKSIWKTRRKFEIQMVGQNLFSIFFKLADDLELILEGRPWFFCKSVILFDRLCQAVDRDQIRLTSSPYWMKIDSISPEFDKEDLLQAIGAYVQRPLRRGIFVSTNAVSKVW